MPWVVTTEDLMAMAAESCREEGVSLAQAAEAFKRAYVRDALAKSGNNKVKAAAETGLNRSTIARWAKEGGNHPKKRVKGASKEIPWVPGCEEPPNHQPFVRSVDE